MNPTSTAFACLALLTLHSSASAATHTWNGQGATGLWSNPNNWVNFSVPPANGSGTVVLGSGGLWSASTNDIPGLTLTELRFNNCFQLIRGLNGGASVSLTGKIRVSGAAHPTLDSSLSISLSPGTHRIEMVSTPNVAGYIDRPSLTLKCQLSGSGGLEITGSYNQFSDSTVVNLFPQANNTYTGSTKVLGGILNLKGGYQSYLVNPSNAALLIPTWISRTAVPGALTIGSSFGDIARVEFKASNQVGNSSIVTIHPDNTLDLDRYPDTIGGLICSGNLASYIGGSSTYGRLTVNGSVNVAGQNFLLSDDPNYVPAANASFTFIANDNADAIVGKFANTPEGDLQIINGVNRYFHYAGGTGNDFVLTP